MSNQGLGTQPKEQSRSEGREEDRTNDVDAMDDPVGDALWGRGSSVALNIARGVEMGTRHRSACPES